MRPPSSDGGDPTAADAAADHLNPHRVQYINDIQKLAPVFDAWSRDAKLMAALPTRNTTFLFPQVQRPQHGQQNHTMQK